MSISEKIDKLLATKEKDNIKLATNIITAKINKDNVIAILCIIKKYKQYELSANSGISDKIYNVLSSNLAEFVEKEQHNIVNLFRWALEVFKSEENIKVSHHYYIKYTDHLVLKALEEINRNSSKPTVNEQIPFEE
tara:strand:- start:682 stop:1089 length:408 start_codon:yes stop_codon:yes gene_type:complete